ncbi:MAG: hypothetical protein ACFB16_26460 [Phormidesmis sp.]|mgnify:CR=1 FL=1
MTLTTFSTSPEAQQAAALLDGYHFDLGNHDARQWVSLWLEVHRPLWIRDAVIEALYQGRYKAVSVRQILELWQRRSQPIRHATHDFEAAVCRDYGGAKLAPHVRSVSASAPAKPIKEPIKQKASQRTHQSLSSISFNLSELAGYPDAAYPEASSTDNSAAADSVKNSALSSSHSADAEPALPVRSAARQALAETAEALRTQRQLHKRQLHNSRPAGIEPGIGQSSSRAIQPFKPALPFSAQTLRLAKQKALAIATYSK